MFVHRRIIDVNNLNAIIEEDSSLVGRSLWWFLKKTDGTTFNNAAQASFSFCPFF